MCIRDRLETARSMIALDAKQKALFAAHEHEIASRNGWTACFKTVPRKEGTKTSVGAEVAPGVQRLARDEPADPEQPILVYEVKAAAACE